MQVFPTLHPCAGMYVQHGNRNFIFLGKKTNHLYANMSFGFLLLPGCLAYCVVFQNTIVCL